MNMRLTGTKLLVTISIGMLFLCSNDISAITLGGFEVEYNGSFYDAELDATTYEYSVIGLRHTSAMKYFMLELPHCDEPPVILSSYPYKLVKLGVDEETGIYGIKWERNLSATKMRTYSFTLAGM